VESDLDPSNPLLSRLLWAADPTTQIAILFVLAAGLLAFAVIYLPLLLRLVRTALLDRAVRDACHTDDRPGEEHRREITRAFASSPLAWQWEEFLYRWQASQTDGPRERAPIRLLDIFDQRPLLPTGVRSSLLPVLPGLFLAIGVLGTFIGLTAAVTSTGAGSTDVAGAAASTTLLADQIGLALRTSLWGLLMAIASALGGRVMEGGFERYAESLDHWVERAYGAVSAGELANLSANAQRDALAGLGAELTRFTTDLGERMDRGLSRIEHSSASAAQLVSEEQRGALQTVVRELSLQVQRGVEEHLQQLQLTLARAVDHQGAVTGGLAEAFEQMAANSEAHTRVSQVLEQTAASVRDAARSLSETSSDMTPVLEHLRETGGSLQATAGSMESTQEVVSRSAEGIRSSLDHATAAMTEQRDFIDSSLGEIRTTLELLSTGLGENLDRSLRNVDEALSHTVGRLRETITESNETIGRMALPVRAAEGTTREMHTALERVRDEVVALGDWLGGAVRPVRTSLTQLEERSAEITRALVQFGDRAQTVDKTMDALRSEIHEEGRRMRASHSELGRHLNRTTESVERLDRSAHLVRTTPESPPGVSWTTLERPTPAPVETPSPDPDPDPQPVEASAEPLPDLASSAPVEHPAPTAPVATPIPIAPAPVGETEEATSPPTSTSAPSETAPSETKTKTKAKPRRSRGKRARSATKVMAAAAAAAAKTSVHAGSAAIDPPQVGKRLGPDPYARIGGDSGEALEHQRRLLESAQTMHELEVDDDPEPELTASGVEEMTLSGLLGSRLVLAEADHAAAADGDEPAADSVAEADGNGKNKKRPRAWRLIGRE
jgi:ABC-type transporter Mla subunit MlaD